MGSQTMLAEDTADVHVVGTSEGPEEPVPAPGLWQLVIIDQPVADPVAKLVAQW